MLCRYLMSRLAGSVTCLIPTLLTMTLFPWSVVRAPNSSPTSFMLSRPPPPQAFYTRLSSGIANGESPIQAGCADGLPGRLPDKPTPGSRRRDNDGLFAYLHCMQDVHPYLLYDHVAYRTCMQTGYDDMTCMIFCCLCCWDGRPCALG
ncbi:hypothetical protein F4782DRAFT_446490 [Xylaria castorea]|nr:hypothetical protein F4782DRAFT_446490 [Xylaria castorea]